MWQPNLEAVNINSTGLGSNLMPSEEVAHGTHASVTDTTEDITSPQSETTSPTHHHKPAAEAQGTHLEQATAS
jgi:hypothetical protein